MMILNEKYISWFSILLLLIVLSSCKPNEFIPEFKYVRFNIKITDEFKPISCFNFNMGCICIDKNSSILKLNTDSISVTKKSNILMDNSFSNIFSLKDSIVLNLWSNNRISESYFLDKHFNWIKTDDIIKNVFYEDQNYEITECCFGEFGGSTFFKDKINERVYSIPTTCAVGINLIRGEYILTTSLSHMVTTSDIITIGDPTKLTQLMEDSLKNHCNWWNELLTEDNWESKALELQQGSESIFDTSGISILHSFEHGNELFTLNSDSERTYVSVLKEGRLVEIHQLMDMPIEKHRSKTNTHENGFTIYYKEGKESGIIELNDGIFKTISFEKQKSS